MSKTRTKPYDQMTTAELREETKEFDREQVGVPGRPLTKAQREMHRKAKKAGRPKKGAGATVVGISIERGLLKTVDALAKYRNVGRSELFVSAILGEIDRQRIGGKLLGREDLGGLDAALEEAAAAAQPKHRFVPRSPVKRSAPKRGGTAKKETSSRRRT